MLPIHARKCYSTSLSSASIMSLLRDFKKSTSNKAIHPVENEDFSKRKDFQTLGEMELLNSLQNANKLGRKYFSDANTIATGNQIESMRSLVPALSKFDKNDLTKILQPKLVYNSYYLRSENISQNYINRLTSWKKSLELQNLQNNHLIQAFASLGYLQELKQTSKYSQFGNKNLAFEGDSLLHFVVTKYVQQSSRYGEDRSDSISNFFTARKILIQYLVSNLNLNRVARKLGISQFLLESSAVNHNSVKLEADMVEALIGVIRENFGFKFTVDFILKYILPAAIEMLCDSCSEDFEYDVKQKIYSMARQLSLPQPITSEHYYGNHEIWCSKIIFGEHQLKAYAFSQDMARKEVLHKSYYWLQQQIHNNG